MDRKPRYCPAKDQATRRRRSRTSASSGIASQIDCPPALEHPPEVGAPAVLAKQSDSDYRPGKRSRTWRRLSVG